MQTTAICHKIYDDYVLGTTEFFETRYHGHKVKGSMKHIMDFLLAAVENLKDKQMHYFFAVNRFPPKIRERQGKAVLLPNIMHN